MTRFDCIAQLAAWSQTEPPPHIAPPASTNSMTSSVESTIARRSILLLVTSFS